MTEGTRTNALGIDLADFLTPLADGFVGDCPLGFIPRLLHIAEAEGEATI
jgi:hypothetical protein